LLRPFAKSGCQNHRLRYVFIRERHAAIMYYHWRKRIAVPLSGDAVR
jgi:hypothetical protein